MKRFHVNVSVQDISEGIRFYSARYLSVLCDLDMRWSPNEDDGRVPEALCSRLQRMPPRQGAVSRLPCRQSPT